MSTCLRGCMEDVLMKPSLHFVVWDSCFVEIARARDDL